MEGTKKIFLLATIVLAVCVILIVTNSIAGFVQPGSGEEATSVRIGYLPVVHGLSFYYALEKGYFKDAGLDIEAVRFESPNQIIDALMQNNLDFGSPSTALGITGVADYKNPGKLKIYAVTGGDLDKQNEALLISINSTITSVNDLKGRRLGIVGGSIQWRTIARYMLDQNSLKMDKDVIIVELAPGLQAQALASNQIDALLALEPIPTIIKEKGIGKELVAAPIEKIISSPFYPGAGVVTTKFARENPKTTAKVLEIFRRAIKEINEDPEDARPYLKGYTPLDDGTIKKAPLGLHKMCDSLSQSDIKSVQKFYDIFTFYNVVDGKIDFDNLLFCRS